MVKPMKKIAYIIEKKYDCKIRIVQGASQDLYDALKLSKRGDLYLPVSSSYRKKFLHEGYLLDGVYIGINEAAIFVQKNNPLHIKSLDDFRNTHLNIILANSQNSSIGKNTKKILEKFGGIKFFDSVFDSATEIGVDSADINKALKLKNADIAINWRASAFFKENKPYISIINIDEKYAPSKKLVLNLLSFSKYPIISKAFMKYAKSKDGEKIMKQYGFNK
jgi:molybdate transport system substrate-binding protein